MAITAAIVIAIAVATTDTTAKIVIIRTQRLFLCDEVWAGPVTWFPDLNTVFPTHVESMILCAEVRAGDVGGAVFIADASSSLDTRTIPLGAAPLLIIRVGNT